MSIGLSTYAFFWRCSSKAKEPMDLMAMVEATAAAGADVLQICDYPQLDALSSSDLDALSRAAGELGVALELGMRGIRTPHLERFLELANVLGVRLVRTMLGTKDDRPTVAEAVDELRRVVSRYAECGVRLGLETYEVFPSADLVRVVEGVADPHVGICLDAANPVARLEHPRATIDLVAEHVVNLHVKDFRFERAPGLVGFALSGCPLGTGLLDLDYLYERVAPNRRGISQIVEHWLPWQVDEPTTVRLEQEWTMHSLSTMRAMSA
jgi:sugar phosphate isomerase/epimerase